MVKFLIITQPRSGSAWFMSCLDSHPQIYCPALTTLFSKYNLSPLKGFKPLFLQFYNPESPYYKYRSRSFKRQITHYFNRKKNIFDFLSEMYAERDNAEAIGFKVNYSQIRKHKMVFSWIKRNNGKIIQLVRYNLLKRLVSHKIAHARNLCHSTHSVAPVKVQIDPNALIDDFHKRQKRFDRYKKIFVDVFDIPYLEVRYETLLTDFDSEIHRTLQFLEVDAEAPLSSSLVKVNPDRIEDIIENYSEVKQVLMATEFSSFLK